jgi:hypothetical protein
MNMATAPNIKAARGAEATTAGAAFLVGDALAELEALVAVPDPEEEAPVVVAVEVPVEVARVVDPVAVEAVEEPVSVVSEAPDAEEADALAEEEGVAVGPVYPARVEVA